MSYDLVVFHAPAAPVGGAAFVAWTKQLGAAAPGAPRPALVSWCRDMEDRGGPFDAHRTRDLVVASFGFQAVEEVFHTAFELAAHHQVGLFDPQAGTRWLPNDSAGLYQWSEDQAAGGPGRDAEQVAQAFLDAMVAAGDLEADEYGDWEDLVRQVTVTLDRARRRSPIPALWKLFMSHDAVGELYLDESMLKIQLDAASTRVLGHPPRSETGWV